MDSGTVRRDHLADEGENASEASARSLNQFAANCKLYVNALVGVGADLNQTLLNFLTWADWVDRGSGTPEQASHFDRVAVPEIVLAILQRSDIESHNEVARNFLARMVKRLVTQAHSSSILDLNNLEKTALLELFNPNCKLYASSKTFPKQQAPSKPDDIDEANELWLEAFDVGQEGYCLDAASQTWVKCRAIQLSPTQTEVEVLLLEENTSGKTFRWLPKNTSVLRAYATKRSAPEEERKVADGDESTTCDPSKSPIELSTSPSSLIACISSPEESWRGGLQVGDMCDAKLPGGDLWYQAVVTNMEPATSQKSQVDAQDLLEISFPGQIAKLKTWLKRGSPHEIAPLNSMSNGRRGHLVDRISDRPFADYYVYDKSDESASDDQTIATTRSTYLFSSSPFLIEVINTFAHHKGFETILTVLEQTDHIDVETLSWAVQLVSAVSVFYTRTFVQDYVSKFVQVVRLCIQDFNDQQVRSLTRINVTHMTDGAHRLAIRYMNSQKASALKEELVVILLEKRLASKAIIQRIDGMDALVEIVEMALAADLNPSGLQKELDSVFSPSMPISSQQQQAAAAAVASRLQRLNVNEQLSEEPIQPQATGSGTSPEENKSEKKSYCFVRVPVTKGVSSSTLANIVTSARVVEDAVMGSLAHHEMVKRVLPLIKLLVTTKTLTNELLELLWSAIGHAKGSDDELVAALYLLLRKMIGILQVTHTQRLLELVLQLPQEDYSQFTLDLLVEFCKCSHVGEPKPSQLALDALWQARLETSGLSKKLEQSASQCIQEVIQYHASLDVVRFGSTLKKKSQPESSQPQPVVSATNTEESGKPTQDQLALVFGVLSVALSALPSSESGQLVREALLLRSVEMLRNRTSVVQSLETLEQVVESFPSTKLGTSQEEFQGEGTKQEHLTGGESREEVLLWLEKEHDVLQLCLDEFVEFLESSKTGSKDNMLCAHGSDLQTNLIGRLSWLVYAPSNSSLVLTVAQLDELWQACMRGPSMARMLVFRFLRNAACTRGVMTICSQETLQSIFSKRFCDVSAFAESPELPLSFFVCFQALFVEINISLGRLERANASTNLELLLPPVSLRETTDDEPIALNGFSVKDRDLQGLDVLWYFALHAKSDQVANAAANMLSTLQLLFSKSVSTDAKRDARKEFIHTCIEEMTSAARTTNDVDPVRLRRVLNLLQPLLDNAQPQVSWVCKILGPDAWKVLEPHMAKPKERVIEVIVRTNIRGAPSNLNERPVHFYANDPVWKLRWRVAELFGYSDHGDSLKLVAGGTTVPSSFDTKLLRQLPFFSSGVSLFVCQKPNLNEGKSSDSNSPEPAKDSEGEKLSATSKREALARATLQSMPRSIVMSDPSNTSAFFTVLEACSSCGSDCTSSKEIEDIANDVWNLLLALPSDTKLLEAVEQMSPEVCSLLKGSETSIWRQLYVLELIEARFVNTLASPEVQAETETLLESNSRGWLARFKENSGFELMEEGLTLLVDRIQDSLQPPTERQVELLAKLTRLIFKGIGGLKEYEKIANFVEPNMTGLLKFQNEVEISGSALTAVDTCFPGAHQSHVVTPAQQDSQPDHLEENQAGHGTTQTGMNRISNHGEQGIALAKVAAKVLECFISSPRLNEVTRGETGLAAWAWSVALWATTNGQEHVTTDASLIKTIGRDGICCTRGKLQIATRMICQNGLQAFCADSLERKAKVLTILLRDVTPPIDGSACQHYFELCEHLLTPLAVQADVANGLVLELTNLVKNAPALEVGYEFGVDQVDWALIGRLRLLGLIFDSSSPTSIDSLVEERKLVSKLLLESCLFGNSYHCHREESRRAAYSLLTTLLKHSKEPEIWSQIGEAIAPNISIEAGTLANFMAKRYETVPQNMPNVVSNEGYGWNVDINGDLRNPCGFAGLTNLGFICYMNSLIQQLFMIPRIRYGILSTQEIEQGSKFASEVLEFQRMLAALDLTAKQAYNPVQWCQQFKDEAGNPVDISQQQDAHEFFNVLCDKLDETIKGTSRGPIVQRALGVTIANQLICLDEPGLQRDMAPVTEYCLTQELALDKEGTTLLESLENFVSGEVLNDYRWDEREGAKLRTLKRQCIADLQDVVFIHLKRFRLNWETLMTEKVNSRFEFPHELDLFPYTEKGLQWQEKIRQGQSIEEGEEAKYGSLGAAYYKFRLVGVVVHAGQTLNGGHYFSYIRSRLGRDRGQWFEFNDRVVTPFNVEDLDKATFGGTSSSTMDGFSISNAYMLVYERIEPQQSEAEFVLSPKSDASELVSSAQQKLARGEELCRSEKEAIVPPELYSALESENRVLERVTDIFGSGMAMFFSSVIEHLARNSTVLLAMEKSDACADFLRAASTFTVNTLARANVVVQLPGLVNDLLAIYRVLPVKHAQGCLDMIVESSKMDNVLCDALFGPRVKEQVSSSIRTLCVGLLLKVSSLKTEWKNARELASIFIEIFRSGAVAANFLNSHFWSILSVAAHAFFDVRAELNKADITVLIIDAFLGRNSQFQEDWDVTLLGPHCKEPEMYRHDNPGWDVVFRCLGVITAQSWPFSSSQQSMSSSDEGWCVPSSRSIRALSTRMFYQDALIVACQRATRGESVPLLKEVGNILAHCSRDWEDFSQHALELVVGTIESAASNAFHVLFELLTQLLQVDDALARTRAEWVVGASNTGSLLYIGYRESDPVASGIGLFYAMDLALTTREVPEVLRSSSDLEEKWVPLVHKVIEELGFLETSGQTLLEQTGQGSSTQITCLRTGSVASLRAQLEKLENVVAKIEEPL